MFQKAERAIFDHIENPSNHLKNPRGLELKVLSPKSTWVLATPQEDSLYPLSVGSECSSSSGGSRASAHVTVPPTLGVSLEVDGPLMTLLSHWSQRIDDVVALHDVASSGDTMSLDMALKMVLPECYED